MTLEICRHLIGHQLFLLIILMIVYLFNDFCLTVNNLWVIELDGKYLGSS